MVFEGDLLKDYKLDFKDDKLVKVELPSVEERKVGRWIVNKEKDTICCPFCNDKQEVGKDEVRLLKTAFARFNFCTYCGTEMKGSEPVTKNCNDCVHYTDADEIHGITPCGDCGLNKKNFEQKMGNEV